MPKKIDYKSRISELKRLVESGLTVQEAVSRMGFNPRSTGGFYRNMTLEDKKEIRIACIMNHSGIGKTGSGISVRRSTVDAISFLTEE